MEALIIQKKILGLLCEPSGSDFCRELIPLGLSLDRSLRGLEFIRASTKSVRMKLNADFELFARQSMSLSLEAHPHELDPVSKKIYAGLGLLSQSEWFSESRLYRSNEGHSLCTLCNHEFLSFFQPMVGPSLQFEVETERLVQKISQEFPFAYDSELGFITSNFLVDANRAQRLSFVIIRSGEAGQRLCPFSSNYDLRLVRQCEGEEVFADVDQKAVHYDQARGREPRADLDKFFAYLYYANEITESELDEILNRIGEALQRGASFDRSLMLRFVLTRFLEHSCQESPGLQIDAKTRADLYREAIRDVLYLLTKRGFHV